MIHRPLKFALLVDSRAMQAWEREVIDRVHRSGAARLVLILRNTGKARRRTLREFWRHGLYFALRVLVRPRAWRSTQWPKELHAVPLVDVVPVAAHDSWSKLPEGIVMQLCDAKVDFVLRFGFNLLTGEVLNATPLGVWSFHHGDFEHYRGRPAGFWEMLDRSPVCGATLQRLSERLDGGSVIERGWFQTSFISWAVTIDRLYFGSAHLVASACVRASTGRLSMVTPGRLGRARKLPTNLDVIRHIWSSALALVRYGYYGAFLVKRWTVALGSANDPNRPWSADDLRWVEPRSGQFVADPFLLAAKPNVRILCERLVRQRGKGDIVVLVESARGQFSTQELLETREHLSFPSVFRVDGEAWLLAEQSERGDLVAYRFDEDSMAVGAETVLIQNCRLLDPVIFLHGGTWWMFCTSAGMSSTSHLNVYYSDKPLGGWQPHPLNPVVTDVRRARSAGTPLFHNGRLYRFGQDCATTYGGAVTVAAVDVLSRCDYRESVVDRIAPPGPPWGSDGIHTINAHEGVVTLDACTHAFSLRAGIDRAFQRWLSARRRRRLTADLRARI